jgi:hypothetical protein
MLLNFICSMIVKLELMKLIFKILISIFTTYSLAAQTLYTTSFEGMADECYFIRRSDPCSWETAMPNVSVTFVNGFDQNRAQIDNAYAVTGSNSLRMFYPKDQFGTANTGGQAPLVVPAANEYYASYYVRFSDDFSYGTTSEGGKLPGLAGGGRCSGCATCTGANGFTCRLMWRKGGTLVLYLYHLDKSNPPCGDNDTLKVNGQKFIITKGTWIKVTERVKVNTGTNHDGEVEIWLNDKPALLRTGIQFVNNGDKVDQLYFSTFHGGSTAAWAPTVDSYLWFDDIKISTDKSYFFTTTDNLTAYSPTMDMRILKSTDLESVTVYDLQGKKIKEILTESNSNDIEVPLKELKSGYYIVVAKYKNEVVTKKIYITE